jgi:antitoxin component YwqK of YwqJK toxin-antitoxin module
MEAWTKYNIRTLIEHTSTNVFHTEMDGNGLRHGQTYTYDAQQHIIRSESFNQNMFHGETTDYAVGGDVITKNYVYGSEHGHRTTWRPGIGIIACQAYQGGQMNGLCKYYSDTGYIDWVEYKHGQPDGVCVKWYPTGNLERMETMFQGRLCGRQLYWYPNGQKYMDVTKNDRGITHGCHHEWYPNGQKSVEYTLNNGKIIGSYRLWAEDGTLRTYTTY